MKRKANISRSEKNRRDKQRNQQWEKDNPIIAHAIKNFRQPSYQTYARIVHYETVTDGCIRNT